MEREHRAEKAQAVRPKKVKKGRSYRLGLYDPDPENDSVKWVSQKYPATRENLRELQSTIAEYNALARQRGDVYLCLGAFLV